ncbi:hypothetical protein [Streptomyces sp. NPDC051079]|uniref:hypothetical protein n=1 Tax=Streptomyces sp. NPDC051079 TaxID=3155043 RepID=UPI0034501921
MTEYVRGSGPYTAERVRPVPGSPAAEEYAALAADPVSGWRAVAEEPPALAGPPAKSAAKGDWVTWAVAQGADETEAEASTKTDLIDAYGGDHAADQ